MFLLDRPSAQGEEMYFVPTSHTYILSYTQLHSETRIPRNFLLFHPQQEAKAYIFCRPINAEKQYAQTFPRVKPLQFILVITIQIQPSSLSLPKLPHKTPKRNQKTVGKFSLFVVQTTSFILILFYMLVYMDALTLCLSLFGLEI